MIDLVLNHLWQSTMFAVGAGLLTLAFRTNGAKIRHWLWFAASVKFLIPFAVLTMLGGYFLTLFQPRVSAPVLSLLEPAILPFSKASLALSGAAAPKPDILDITTVLLALWGFGSVTLAVRWLVRWSALRAVLRGAVDSSIAAPVPVKIGASSLEPGLVGIFRPVILLPSGIVDRLSSEEMEAILAHELCHWRRRDNLLAATHMVVEALFWFHPLVWWLGARLNAERECACDESVLAFGQSPRIYAESILKVCRFYAHSPLACASGVSGANLRQRMEDIMVNRLIVRMNLAKRALLATTAAAAIALPLLTGLVAVPQASATPEEQAAIKLRIRNNIPSPGTEAALRRQFEALVKGHPLTAEMTPEFIAGARPAVDEVAKMAKAWGAFKSITFKSVDPAGGDVYRLSFEHAEIEAGILPLTPDGKIRGMVFHVLPTPAEAAAIQLRIKNNVPSPGTEAALRRHFESLVKGQPLTAEMTPEFIAGARPGVDQVAKMAKAWGALKSIAFKRVDPMGNDNYHLSFEHAQIEAAIRPLTPDGKIPGIGFRVMNDHDALISRGIAYAKAGDAARAEQEFMKGRATAKTGGDLNDLCWQKATANVALKSALADCEAAMAKEPGNPEYLDSHAFVLLRLGRYDEAIADYNRTLAAKVIPNESRFGRAVARARKGDKAGSDEDLAAALRANPGIRAEFQGFGITL